VTASSGALNCGATCAASYASGAMTTLTATAGTGSTFMGWGGACSGTSTTCLVTVSGPTSVSANFVLVPETVTVTKAGPGSGTVSSSPSGINCGATCSTSFDYGTPVTLTAQPTSTSIFAGWSGACTGTGTCMITANAATSVTATFNPAPNIWYTFDGDSKNSGTTGGMDLTAVGVTYVTGKFNHAAQISASGAQYTAGARATIGTYAQGTISMWIHDYVTTNAIFIDFDNRSTSPYGGLQLFPESNGTAGLLLSSTTTSYVPAGNPNVVNIGASGAWHNLILVYNRDNASHNFEVWLDDVLSSSITNNNAASTIFNSSQADQLTVGQASMTIDDVRIYNQVFTQAQQCTVIIGGAWSGTACTLP
jgi:hypothetical protein